MGILHPMRPWVATSKGQEADEETEEEDMTTNDRYVSSREWTMEELTGKYLALLSSIRARERAAFVAGAICDDVNAFGIGWDSDARKKRSRRAHIEALLRYPDGGKT
jgi:hypothetical protein